MILNAEAFKSVVKDGTLKSQGKPPSPQLTDELLEDIPFYLQARAVQTAAEVAGAAPAEKSAVQPGTGGT